MRRVVICVLLLVSLLAAFSPVAAQQEVVHVVQPGDSLYRIGLQYNVSVAALAQANNISNVAHIYSGQRLVIPDLSGAVENPLVAVEPTYHVVQPGETLAGIANRYGLTLAQISQINNISNPNRILRGQTLTVFEAQGNSANITSASAATPTGLVYVIQPGDRLADIAQRYGVSWPAIVQANNITDPNRIKVGESIFIPEATAINDLGIISLNAQTTLANVPKPTITSGKQIIIDLSDSRIYAYEDGVLVRNVLASMGLPATPTVTGSFTVERKYESQTMSGPGYYLPGVQWIMYFYSGYAIHGTYWHNNFGQPMSHGCVNLPNDEALWFYNWAPHGTPVLVQQ
jgi:LysM repeat protein